MNGRPESTALAKCDQDIVDTKRLGLLQKPGPGASVGVRGEEEAAGIGAQWSGVEWVE